MSSSDQNAKAGHKVALQVPYLQIIKKAPPGSGSTTHLPKSPVPQKVQESVWSQVALALSKSSTLQRSVIDDDKPSPDAAGDLIDDSDLNPEEDKPNVDTSPKSRVTRRSIVVQNSSPAVSETTGDTNEEKSLRSRRSSSRPVESPKTRKVSLSPVKKKAKTVADVQEPSFQKHWKIGSDNKIRIPLENLSATELEAVLKQYQNSQSIRPIQSSELTSTSTKASSTPRPSSSSNVSEVSSSLSTGGRSKYFCLGCRIDLKELQPFNLHFQNEHLNNGRYICLQCSTDYKLQTSLTRHMKTCKGCKPEKETPSSSSSTIVRKKKIVFSAPVKSASLGISSKTKQQQQQLGQYSCHGCHISFKTQQLVSNHFQEEHVKHGRFICLHCNFDYGILGSLTRHQRNCKQDKQNQSRMFSSKTKRSYSSRNEDNNEGDEEEEDSNKTTEYKHVPKLSKSSSAFRLLRLKSKESRDIKQELTGRFLCRGCHMSFEIQKVATHHFRTKHFKNGRYFCLDCGSNYQNLSNLTRHQKEGCKPDKPKYKRRSVSKKPAFSYSCRGCHIKFKTGKLITAHYRQKHFKDGRYLCLNCPSTFTMQNNLASHTKICKGSVLSNGDLSEDEQDEPDMDIRDHEEMSNLPSKSNHARPKGMRKIGKSRNYSYICQGCDINFPSQYPYGQHMRNEHMVNGAYICPRCQSAFNLIYKLNCHMQECQKRKPKPTTKKISMDKPLIEKKKPQITHNKQRSSEDNNTGERVACTICHERFYGKDALIEHLAVHLKK